MRLEDKLQLLRKQNGYSQEGLADRLGVSRQTIGKWENGQGVPELPSLIRLSAIYGITIDRIVKDDDDCNVTLTPFGHMDRDKIISFLIRAKRETYAGKGPEEVSTRIASHDLKYQEEHYLYYDTYLGGEKFSGEEAVWKNEIPIWCMNYSGRVIGEHFSGDFLKEALLKVTVDLPYRGPAIYHNGEYHYHCKVEGEFIWFQGYEDIFYRDEKIYECYFHGGEIV